jgi:predicted SAM-dependent methyltransferase
MKLNLGCGIHKLKDFTNIDVSNYCEPDVIADVLELPYEKNSADIIYAGHLIEHLEPEELYGAIKHWYDILKPGGKLYLTFPDFEKIFEMWDNGWANWKEVNGVLFGMDRPKDAGVYVYHRQLVSVATVKPFLIKIFGNMTNEEECEYIQARLYWQSTVTAIKPEANEEAKPEVEVAVA